MNTLEYLYKRYFGFDAGRVAAYETEKSQINVSSEILKARTAAGLTQRELAASVGTSASCMSRIESPEYGGHTMKVLRAVAAACGCRVVVKFEKIEK